MKRLADLLTLGRFLLSLGIRRIPGGHIWTRIESAKVLAVLIFLWAVRA